MHLLVLLNSSDGGFIPSALRYIESCITKCNDVFFDDNMIMYLNSLLEKYRGKFEGTQLVIPDEIVDRTNDVKQSLIATYRFLHDTDLFDGDEKFWGTIAKS